jgi:predicted transcriptional regulator
MRLLWTQGPLRGKAIHARVNAQRQSTTQRKIAYTTVMTTVDHLVDKGLLESIRKVGEGREEGQPSPADPTSDFSVGSKSKPYFSP